MGPTVQGPIAAASLAGDRFIPARAAPEGTAIHPIIRLSDIPPARLRALPRGGVMLTTSMGWIQFGVPMWTNKDAKDLFDQEVGVSADKGQIPFGMPVTYVFDLDYVPAHDGLLAADFIQYMFFVTKGTRYTLIAPDAATGARLKNFLDLSYLGPRAADLNRRVAQEYPAWARGVPDLQAEMERGFSAVSAEALRDIKTLNPMGVIRIGNVIIKKVAAMRYAIMDQGEHLGFLDLRDFPLPPASMPFCDTPPPDADATALLADLLQSGRAGLWPIGTGYGFLPREETSGFMLWNRGRCLLVDPPSITLEYLAALAVPKEAIDGVLLTHGHTDHYGNAIARLLVAAPQLNLYTTATIRQMLIEQHQLALGHKVPSLGEWNWVPLRPQQFISVLGLALRPEYTLHSVPCLGFEIWDRSNVRRGCPRVLFSGDTLLDPDYVEMLTRTGANGKGGPVMSYERAVHVLRPIDLLRHRRPRPTPIVALWDGGIRPLHAGPDTLRALIDELQGQGADVSQVFANHLSAAQAAQVGIQKWRPGHPGFIAL